MLPLKKYNLGAIVQRQVERWNGKPQSLDQWDVASVVWNLYYLLQPVPINTNQLVSLTQISRILSCRGTNTTSPAATAVPNIFNCSHATSTLLHLLQISVCNRRRIHQHAGGEQRRVHLRTTTDTGTRMTVRQQTTSLTIPVRQQTMSLTIPTRQQMTSHHGEPKASHYQRSGPGWRSFWSLRRRGRPATA